MKKILITLCFLQIVVLSLKAQSPTNFLQPSLYQVTGAPTEENNSDAQANLQQFYPWARVSGFTSLSNINEDSIKNSTTPLDLQVQLMPHLPDHRIIEINLNYNFGRKNDSASLSELRLVSFFNPDVNRNVFSAGLQYNLLQNKFHGINTVTNQQVADSNYTFLSWKVGGEYSHQFSNIEGMADSVDIPTYEDPNTIVRQKASDKLEYANWIISTSFGLHHVCRIDHQQINLGFVVKPYIRAVDIVSGSESAFNAIIYADNNNKLFPKAYWSGGLSLSFYINNITFSFTHEGTLKETSNKEFNGGYSIIKIGYTGNFISFK